jgi:hypothetical protein
MRDERKIGEWSMVNGEWRKIVFIYSRFTIHDLFVFPSSLIPPPSSLHPSLCANIAACPERTRPGALAFVLDTVSLFP